MSVVKIGTVPELGFVGSGEIEDSEKWFFLGAFFPMGLGAGFIPGSLWGIEIITTARF